MASTRKNTISLRSLILPFVTLVVIHEVLSEKPSSFEVNAVVKQDVTFQFNTSRNNSILGAKFGLDGNKSYPVPKFITAIMKQGKDEITCGDDLDGPAANYNGRVSFVGSLIKGFAWFLLSNLSLNDTNTYMTVVREDSDKNYRQKKVFRLIVRDKERTSPSQTSEAGFTDFEGVAIKKCISYRIVGKESESTVKSAIRNAYWNISINHNIKISSPRKINKTVRVGFYISFTKAINRTYAFSFLQRAQREKRLKGYNITCFERLNLKPKPAAKDKPSSMCPYLIAFIVFIGLLIVVLFIIFVLYKLCPDHFLPFKKAVKELTRRSRDN